jgi:hypothetical protein
MRATLTASATLTVRRQGLGAVLAQVFAGHCPTYQAPFVATALVELEPGMPEPVMELRTREGRPHPHFRISTVHAKGARLLCHEIRERGQP